MKQFRVSVKGYAKGTKEHLFIESATCYSVAVHRALKKFRDMYKFVSYDQINVKVEM